MSKFFAVLLILLAATASAVFHSCGKAPKKLEIEKTEAAAEDTEPAGIAQKLSGVKYTQSKDGKLEWELTATGVQQALEGPTQLQQVKITYFGDPDKITVVTADSGEYETATKNARLHGNVLVKMTDGTSLSASALVWDQATRLLTGEGQVKISQGNSIIQGTGFELSPEAETIQLFQVNGVIRQEEKKT